jgi:hypothetical protein
MKILYITGGMFPDYLNDSVFHGLRALYGTDAVDSNCLTYLYKPYTSEEQKLKLYGRGFTLYSTLDTDNTDRTDLPHKIRSKYFDLIIYGSMWRCLDYFDLVNEHYPKNKIILLDGEDQRKLHRLHRKYPCFKRELRKNRKGLYPVSFSIPEEKIISSPVEKDRKFATVVPGDTSTYIFFNESEYYHDYARSYFGITTKKMGWDCMRHYEILGSYCMPYFMDVKKCPPLTMVNFPKDLCLQANKMIETDTVNDDQYFEILNRAFQQLKDHLTTRKVAEYMLSKVSAI